MTGLSRKTVLITGASSGIGEAMAEIFAAAGNDLVIVARRHDRLVAIQQRLETAHSVRVTVLTADLADPSGAAGLLRALSEQNLDIDVLVNNAGYSVAGGLEERALSEYLAMMQVSLQSNVTLIHGLLPGMLQRGFGRVLTISSIAGALPAVKGHAVYSAAKAFLIHLSLSLDLDHRQQDIRFTVVCPGLVATEFHGRSGTEAALRRSPEWMVMSAADAARKSVDALANNRPYVVLGAANQFAVSLMQRLPVAWGVRMAEALH